MLSNKFKGKIVSVIGKLILAVFFAGTLLTASAAEHYVKNTEQYMHDKVSEINLTFARPLSFVQLYPGNLCKQCTITLKIDVPSPADAAAGTTTENIKIPSLSGSPLKETKLKADKFGTITIFLNFSEIVSLEVNQNANKNNLKIITTPYERPADGSPEAKANSATVAGILPTRIFVINLESSVLPLSLKKLDNFAELKDYKNYITRIEFNNQKWYRHRLGFAASEEEAADLLVKAKSYFPEAWIDTASPSEVSIARKYYTLYPDRLTTTPKEQVTTAKPTVSKPVEENKGINAGAAGAVVAIIPKEIPKKELIGAETGAGTSDTTPAIAAVPASKSDTTIQGKSSVATAPPTVTSGTDEKIRVLMERARQAIVDGNYELAIGIYSKILSTENLEERKNAREYLGLARERNGQKSQARAEYEEYLKDYPAGTDAERVRQRLIGLDTAKAAPRQELVKTETKKEEAEWDVFNSFSQYYRNQNTKLDAPPATTNGTGTSQAFTADKSLSTDFSSSGRYRGERYDMRYQLNLSDYYSFLQTSTKKQDFRVNNAYYDIADKETSMSYRVGRQSQNSYGILGRYDGLFYSYRFDPKYKFNFAYGNPVDFQVTKTLNTAKKVLGVSMDMGTFDNHWDGNIYAVQQTYDGVVDRKAIGTEIKYLAQEFTAFSILDYDLNFNEINTVLFFSSWRFKDNSSVNLNMDYRKTPPAALSTAVTPGTGATDLSQLLQLYSESVVKELAKDRMANAYNATASYNLPIGQNYQLSTDVTYSYTGSTPSSDYISTPIPAAPSIGNTLSYGGSLTGNNMLFDNDIAIIALRYTDVSTGASWSANFNDRLTLNSDWRINPKFTVNHQNNASDSSSKMIYKPGFRFEYKADKSMRFDVELGVELSKTKGGVNNGATETDHFIYAGYIYDF